MRRLHTVVILLVAAVACTKSLPAETLILQISNQLGRSISEIHKKPCGDLEISFTPIESSRFAPGESRGLVLPATCVDLVAYDSRGHIVGEQRGLTMRPGARWVLRR